MIAARLSRWSGLLSLVCVLTTASAASATNIIDLNFTSVSSATVAFGGHQFSFPDGAGGFDFSITLDNSLPVVYQTFLGLKGNIGGTFTISGPVIVGQTTAAVTGTGTFSIDDGFGNLLTADLKWVDIEQKGTAGALNTVGTVNLQNMAYGGANAGMLALAGNPDGVVAASFQFVPGKSLKQLYDAPAGAGALKTSYSGSLYSVPDGGATASLLGLALVGFGMLRSRLNL